METCLDYAYGATNVKWLNGKKKIANGLEIDCECSIPPISVNKL